MSKYNKPFEEFTTSDMLQRIIKEKHLTYLTIEVTIRYAEDKLTKSKLSDAEKNTTYSLLANLRNQQEQLSKEIKIAKIMKKEMKEDDK